MVEVPEGHKKCNKCRRHLPMDAFYARTMSADGKAATCKTCANEITKDWNAKHADERFATRRRSHLERNFGITLEQYSELLQKQSGCCAVCDRPASFFPRELAVDHNHSTGEIRGLLCTACNYRMVAKHKDGAILRRIADYIEQGTGWVVPPKPKKKRIKKI